jgi:hypothetical protein
MSITANVRRCAGALSTAHYSNPRPYSVKPQLRTENSSEAEHRSCFGEERNAHPLLGEVGQARLVIIV